MIILEILPNFSNLILNLRRTDLFPSPLNRKVSRKSLGTKRTVTTFKRGLHTTMAWAAVTDQEGLVLPESVGRKCKTADPRENATVLQVLIYAFSHTHTHRCWSCTKKPTYTILLLLLCFALTESPRQQSSRAPRSWQLNDDPVAKTFL